MYGRPALECEGRYEGGKIIFDRTPVFPEGARLRINVRVEAEAEDGDAEKIWTDEEKAKWESQAVVFPYGKPPADYQALVDRGLETAAKALSGGEFDLVVLDEINVALSFGLIRWQSLEAAIDNKAEKTEVVLTGRGATPELLAKADLVTEMKEIKHYYTKGVEARPGIEC